MAIDIDNNQQVLAIPALFRLAFRPLFLAGTLFSILAISWWLYFWQAPFNWTPYGGPIWWHGHEMLFGFGATIVAGFLLTAVQSWTGVTGLRGAPLALLSTLWLAGRLSIAFDLGLSGYLVALIDVAFMLFVSMAMAYPIIKVKQWQNLMFIPLLLALALFNAVSHWAILTSQQPLAMQSLHATIMIFILIIAILGGRVIPAFTANTVNCAKALPKQWLERSSIITILMMTVIALIGFSKVPETILLLTSSLAAITNGIRFLRWGGQHCWSEPLLWSLHLAYAFIPIGFILFALQSVELLTSASTALHSFTVGAMGGMILAMISRVTLGHTGRTQEIHTLVAPSFVCILTAVLLRIMIPELIPAKYTLGIALSGGLWVTAYSIYLYIYAPMLITIRVDGQQG